MDSDVSWDSGVLDRIVHLTQGSGRRWAVALESDAEPIAPILCDADEQQATRVAVAAAMEHAAAILVCYEDLTVCWLDHERVRQGAWMWDLS